MQILKEQDLSIKLIDMSIEMLSTIDYKKTYCEGQLQLLKYEKSVLLDDFHSFKSVEKDYSILGRIELAINHLERKANSFIINDFDK
jgi:hypothetical protein